MSFWRSLLAGAAFCGAFMPLGSIAGAQVAPPAQKYYVPEVPADMGPVEFYLLTGGVGDEVNDRFGHTAIRVRNPEEGTDVSFNWGKYDFDSPGFLWKFFRGELTYTMGVHTFQGDVVHFEEMGRRLVMDRLNLTSRQKRRLLEKIAWNAVPENRTFAYQYWYKNCATIPRDYLDEVLEGQVRAKYFSAPGAKVFRDYVRGNLALTPFVAPLLDIFMNGNIDRPITVWEDMFLPENLRQHLLGMPSIDDDGNPVPGTKLLTDSRVLVDNPEEFAAPFNDYMVMSAPAFLFLVLGWLLLLSAKFKPELPTVWSYRFFGAGAVYWGLLSGILGTTLALNWALSGHPDGWHNVNLMLFWPLDFLLIPIGVSLARAGQPIKDRYPFLHAGAILCAGHLLLFTALCGLVGLHVIQQDIWRVAFWFGTPMVLIASTLPVSGLSRAAPAAREPVQVLTAKSAKIAKGRH